MQKANLEFVIEQASGARSGDAFAKAVRDSIEVGVVVPSILRAKLADAGFAVVDDVAALAEYGLASLKTLKRVMVNDKKGELVAMGAAGDPGEAILHAALGYFREHPLPDSEVPAGLAEVPAPVA